MGHGTSPCGHEISPAVLTNPNIRTEKVGGSTNGIGSFYPCQMRLENKELKEEREGREARRGGGRGEGRERGRD